MSTTGWLVLGVFTLSLVAGFWLLYVKLMGKSFLPKSASISSFNNKGWWPLGAVSAIALAVAIWWYWSAIMGLSFFWKLVACAVPIFFGWRLSKGLKFSLATNLFWGGAIAMLAVFLLSNYGKVAETTVNRGEANFAAGTLSAGSSCPGTDLVVKRAGSKLKVQPGCDEYILDLSSIPEGPMLDLDPNDLATEGMSSSEFYSFEYFYRGGVLKGRVTPVAAGFTSNGLPEVTAFFYPRSGS